MLTQPTLSTLILLLLITGCAKHADFVDMRQDVTEVQKTQDQITKRQEALQRRLQTVEGKLGVKPTPGDEGQKLAEEVQHVNSRLRELEMRLVRIEEGRIGVASIKPMDPRAVPDKSAEAGDSPPMMPGTPAITPTSAFNLAYNDYLNGRYDLAVTGFQRFLKDFSTTSLAPVAQYWLGESYFSKKDYGRAMQSFERVIADYPQSEKVPAALYKLGLSAVEAGDSPRAKTYLKRVIQDFSTSDEAKLAKNKLADIR